MKIPLTNWWLKVYWWTPDLEVGRYSVTHDMMTIHALNLCLLSIEVSDEAPTGPK
jgi:hypothetical protein